MDVRALEADGIKFANTAIAWDQQGYADEAIFFYKASTRLLTAKYDC